MKRLFLLTALGLLALTCTKTYAEEKVSVYAEEWVDSVLPGMWVDLIVKIDPKDTPIAAAGLTVVAEPPEGVEAAAARIPAPADGKPWTDPFVVRLPVRVAADGRYEIPVKIGGTYADGKALARTVKATVFADAAATRHLDAKVRIKETPVIVGKANAIVVDAEVVALGYHVYGLAGKDDGMPVKGLLLPAPGAAPRWQGGGPNSPPDRKYDTAFTFEIPFVPTKAGKIEARVMLFWQACTEEICDPNVVVYLPVSFEAAQGSGTIGAVPAKEPGAAAAAAEAKEAGKAGATGGEAEDLKKKSIWELIVLAIGGGLIALAMPCTYPLIPITISFFTKQAEARDGKVTGLALAYGAGIVVIFTAIGLLFAKPISAFAAGAVINAVFALLFLVFGLSLVGLFDISLPGWFNDIAAKASGTGGYLSVFAMGMTLVITSFTCTAPIVGLVLALSGESGTNWIIGMTMAVFGLTMAIPFVFLSLSPKALQAMPRSGEWMKTLKVSLGIVELGLVLKFLSNVDFAIGTFWIDRELFLVLWGLSFLVTGLYLLGVHKVFIRTARWAVGPKQLGIGVALLALTAYLYSGVGGRLLNDNIEAFLPRLPDRKQEYVEAFHAVVKEDYERGVERARALGAPIFLDFTGFV